uniref:ShKT domain-containing protein n=1 Tax=Caenorhabditis japonica TaxID=281687 RepID=A0A8R1DP37_CAEJA
MTYAYSTLFCCLLLALNCSAVDDDTTTTVAPAETTTVTVTTVTGTTVTGADTTAASGQTTAATTAATTAGTGTTTASCADDPNTDCSQYLSLCSNAKYIPLLQTFCPKSCGYCGGGSTVAPTSCVDSAINCANWKKNGFCESTFYTCQQKKDYCAQSCSLCTTTC